MTLSVNVIRKVSGNYTAVYGGQKVTTQAPQPAPAKIRTAPRKPATKQAVNAALAEIAQEPVTVSKNIPLADYVKDHPEAGIPVKGDKISFVTITTQEYNGFIIPAPVENLPAYILVNQRGDLMRMVSSECKENQITGDVLELSWCYSQCDRNTISDIVRKQKRLTRWLNASLKSKPEKEEVILSEKKTGEHSFKFFAQYFTDQLKDMKLKDNSFFAISGRFFPARTMRDIFKLLKNELVTLTVNHVTKTVEIIYQCDGLKGRSTIKAQTLEGIPHLIPVV